MIAILRLEAIGDAYNSKMRVEALPLCMLDKNIQKLMNPPIRQPWVASIEGPCSRYGLSRKFLPFKKDYSKSNGIGSRGVYLCFTLYSGKYYEIRKLLTWKREDRYFVKVSDRGEIARVDKGEVVSWASLQKSVVT